MLTKVRSYTPPSDCINVRLRYAAAHSQDHMYGIPMVDVKWHTGPGGERRVISSDSRIAKIWCAQKRMQAVATLSKLMRHYLFLSPGMQATVQRSLRLSRRRISTTFAYGLAVVRANALTRGRNHAWR